MKHMVTCALVSLLWIRFICDVLVYIVNVIVYCYFIKRLHAYDSIQKPHQHIGVRKGVNIIESNVNWWMTTNADLVDPRNENILKCLQMHVISLNAVQLHIIKNILLYSDTVALKQNEHVCIVCEICLLRLSFMNQGKSCILLCYWFIQCLHWIKIESKNTT